MTKLLINNIKIGLNEDENNAIARAKKVLKNESI